MSNILNISDFIGTHFLAETVYGAGKFNDYITECQEETLREILGDEIANDLEIQLETVLDQKYTDLIEGIIYTNSRGIIIKNKGLKSVLLGLTFHKIVADNFQSTSTGMLNQFNENSKRLTPDQVAQFANQRYNKASVLNDKDIFPFLDEYRQSSDTIDSSVDNTGTYTINVPNTLYLVDGDTVTIEGTEYVISGLVVDTSFVITEATTGLEFSSKDYVWEPFKDISKFNYRISWL